MSENEDSCMYHECTDNPDGALDFYFGVRWLCTEHYEKLQQDWHQTDGPEIHTPIDAS